ncbi:ferritin family protein [Geobacter sp. AOG1]|uniref:ferritin-like domain-containing protein n=1 Tax=Geobacter sp. AOG1 TaxID=1566346 RepID=UPI001CC4BE92|nr:ferritin family protein [Geobacter sp. AOG1]GFE57880.1 rubrerythrin [Geobacter sp. AOG1]
MNVFDFAMKMELDGKAYYEKMAAETSFNGLKTIFTMLAGDEQKHYDTVLAMKEGADGGMASTTVLEKAKNVFQELAGETHLLGGMKKDLDGYQHAMKIEADSVRLYEDMAKRESNPDTVMLLLKIASEEKKHYNIMENLYDFVLKPEYFLAWREFGNLSEL